MKLSRLFTLIFMSLFLFISLTLIVVGDNTVIYSSFDSISDINSDEVEKEFEESAIDISDVGLNVHNVIDINSLSKIATNIDRVEVYDHLTYYELVKKLNKSLRGVLSGKGNVIATRCLKYKMNPYMVTAIMLHETGCFSSCSYLATHNYNFGGLKGANGNYQSFASVEQGINKMVDIIYYGYWKLGLTSPETMNSKYAADPNWKVRVRQHMNTIRSR